jgi:hypothetical protein
VPDERVSSRWPRPRRAEQLAGPARLQWRSDR